MQGCPALGRSYECVSAPCDKSTRAVPKYLNHGDGCSLEQVDTLKGSSHWHGIGLVDVGLTMRNGRKGCWLVDGAEKSVLRSVRFYISWLKGSSNPHQTSSESLFTNRTETLPVSKMPRMVVMFCIAVKQDDWLFG